MPEPSDLLATGAARDAGIRFLYADVTDSARALARSHLAGPAAATALSECLAAAAILGADLELPEETVSLYLKSDGPIESALVECAFDGALRGFTAKKILDAFDGEAEPDMDAVFGTHGEVRVMRSSPGQVIAQSGFFVDKPPRPGVVLSRYYNEALQRRAAAIVTALPGEDGPDIVRAFLVECMPDGDESLFRSAAAQIEGEGFHESLEATLGPVPLLGELGISGEIVADDPRPLRFGCRCSRDRARETLQTLSAQELRDMAKSGRNTDIYCHMCGRSYSFSPDELRALGE